MSIPLQEYSKQHSRPRQKRHQLNGAGASQTSGINKAPGHSERNEVESRNLSACLLASKRFSASALKLTVLPRAGPPGFTAIHTEGASVSGPFGWVLSMAKNGEKARIFIGFPACPASPGAFGGGAPAQPKQDLQPQKGILPLHYFAFYIIAQEISFVYLYFPKNCLIFRPKMAKISTKPTIFSQY